MMPESAPGPFPVAGRWACCCVICAEDASEARTEELLHWVLVDSRNGRYEGGLGPEVRHALADLGVPLLERDMVCEGDPPTA